MKEKCNSYESYFVFRNDEEFNEHISNCEDCKQEHEIQLKVSSLVRSVASEYKKREQQKKTIYKLVSCLMLLVFTLSGVLTYTVEANKISNLNIGAEDNVNYDMGMPVDEYGLLKI